MSEHAYCGRGWAAIWRQVGSSGVSFDGCDACRARWWAAWHSVVRINARDNVPRMRALRRTVEQYGAPAGVVDQARDALSPPAAARYVKVIA